MIMRLLSRYIFRTISLAILSVLLVIISLDLLAVLIDELDQLSANYTFFEVLIYTGLTAPESFNEFMPFAALVGSLVGLGSLSNIYTGLNIANNSSLQSQKFLDLNNNYLEFEL